MNVLLVWGWVWGGWVGPARWAGRGSAGGGGAGEGEAAPVRARRVGHDGPRLHARAATVDARIGSEWGRVRDRRPRAGGWSRRVVGGVAPAGGQPLQRSVERCARARAPGERDVVAVG